jgi:hypothetical protein
MSVIVATLETLHDACNSGHPGDPDACSSGHPGDPDVCNSGHPGDPDMPLIVATLETMMPVIVAFKMLIIICNMIRGPSSPLLSCIAMNSHAFMYSHEQPYFHV